VVTLGWAEPNKSKSSAGLVEQVVAGRMSFQWPKQQHQGIEGNTSETVQETVTREPQKRATIFHYNSRISWWIFYTFCTNGNRKEYSTTRLFNGLMTSKLHHTAMFTPLSCYIVGNNNTTK